MALCCVRNLRAENISCGKRKDSSVIGVKELCALLAAGGMGASGTLAVQHVKPTAAHHAKSKPAPRRIAAKPRAPARLTDCPATAASLGSGALGSLAPIAPLQETPMAALTSPTMMGAPFSIGSFAAPPPVNGGARESALPAPSGQTPGVPEPAAWALMVSGFGMVGVAARRTQARNAQHPAA